MNDMSLMNLQAGKTWIGAEAIEALAGRLRGRVLDASDAAYEEARTIWNVMVDRRPALIVQCAGAADVINAVRFASDNKLLVSVRGGGHNIAGNAVCDGGLMIDLSPMKSGKVVERLSSGDLVAGRISEAYTKNLMVASKGFVRKAALA